MKNQAGFSLILFSAFASVIGISAVMLMLKSEQGVKFRTIEHLTTVFESHRDQTKALMASYDECVHNLKTQKIDEDLKIQPPQTEPSIRRMDGTRLLWPNQEIKTRHGSLRVEAIKVEMATNRVTGALQEHLNVYVNMNPENRKNFPMVSTKTMRIPLVVGKNGADEIVHCFHEEGDSIQKYIENICLDSGGTYSSTFEKCTDANLSVTSDTVHCGFDLVRVELIDDTYKIVCGKGVQDVSN